MSDQPLDQNQNLSNAQVPVAPPSNGIDGTPSSTPASVDTTAPTEAEPPKPSRSETRAIASIRRENRELHRALGRMEAKLEALGQPAPQQTEGDPSPATRQGPTPEHVAALEADAEVAQTVIERLEDALDNLDDGDEVMKTITSPTFALSTVMRDFLGETEHPAQMAKWMADNPGEARRISRLSPVMALRALERHEAKLATTPAGKKGTQAPAPLTKVGGSSRASIDPRTGPTTGSMDDYAKWRSRQA